MNFNLNGVMVFEKGLTSKGKPLTHMTFQRFSMLPIHKADAILAANESLKRMRHK